MTYPFLLAIITGLIVIAGVTIASYLSRDEDDENFDYKNALENQK